MADLTEEEAVLHLKRALGELDSGDAVPRALPTVHVPLPKPKVQKTMPQQAPQTARPMGINAMSAMVGPSPGPGGSSAAPVKQPTWAEIRQQQEQEQKQQAMQKDMQRELQKHMQQSTQQARQPPPESHPAFPPGMMPPMMKPPGGPGGPGGMPPSGPGGMPPGMQGLPPMPGMPPGFPGMPGMPPMPAGAAPGPAKNSVAAQIEAAMTPGKTQAHIDIPQAKIGMVIGRNGATLGAIKAYAKATCFIQQNTPDEDKARITIVGSATEVEKCKQTANALIDGTMSAATLFQLAGVPLPAGGAGEASQSDRDRIGGGGSSSSVVMPHGMPPGFPHGMPPGMPHGMPPGFPGMPGVPIATIAGMPENQQMQSNLNDYYARVWATYAADKPAAPGGGAHLMPTGPAFDKEALAKLAARASEPEAEQPPLPPDSGYNAGGNNPSHRGVPISSLPRMNDPGFAPHPSAHDDYAAPSYNSVAPPKDMYGEMDRMPSGFHDDGAFDPEAGVPAVSSTAGARRPDGKMGFNPISLKTTEPRPAQKDNDSVAKMMERLQGNVTQNKEAKKEAEEAPPPVRMQMTGARRGAPGSLSQMMEAGGPGAAFREDTRTQADVVFEALMGRMTSVTAPEDVDNLGREVLIRFPSFSTQQVTELLQKIDSNAGLQNGDFQSELSRVLIPRLKEFNSSQFTTLTSTFASWSNDARGNKKKGRFSEFSKAFFMAASAEMTSRLMEYAPHEINCCLAAFVSVGFNEHKFFASVGRAALARHSSFAPVQLTALLAILSEMRLVHVDLFNASAQFLSMRAKELRPVDVIRVLRSFSKCSVHHHGMCRAIGDEVVLRIRMKSSNFKVEDLCEIAYSFCVLSYYHEDMFKILFKELEKSPMISTDALIQLYEVHLTLDAEHKDAYSAYRMDRDLANALQEHYREHRKDERRCSERQRNDVASVLKSLVDGSVHVNHRTSIGLLVDVAALRKRSSTDGFIHVDLDSTVTVVRSLDQDENSPANIIIEGPVALRRRILAKHGLRLVTVRESEWRELDDSKDKRRHLRSLLSALGDVLE